MLPSAQGNPIIPIIAVFQQDLPLRYQWIPLLIGEKPSMTSFCFLFIKQLLVIVLSGFQSVFIPCLFKVLSSFFFVVDTHIARWQIMQYCCNTKTMESFYIDPWKAGEKKRFLCVPSKAPTDTPTPQIMPRTYMLLRVGTPPTWGFHTVLCRAPTRCHHRCECKGRCVLIFIPQWSLHFRPEGCIM